MPAARPPIFHDGPLQDVQGGRMPPAPGAAPIPVPFRVAGGDPPSDFSTSMLALVQDERAAAQEIKNSVGELALQVGKMTTFFDPSVTAGTRRSLVSMDRQELVSAFQEAIMTSAATAPSAASAGAQAATGGAPPAPGAPGGPAAPGAPYDVSPASTGDVTSRPLPRSTPAGPGGFAVYEGYAGMAGRPSGGMMFDPLGLRAGIHQTGFNVGGIRSKIGGSLQRFVSERQIGPDLVQDDAGQFVWGKGSARAGLAATEHEVAQFDKAQKIQGGLQNMFGEIAGGKGVTQAAIGMLPEGAAAGLGMAAGGVTAAYMASNLLASQQAQNAGYQRMIGGSNMEAMGERARAQLFGLSNRPLLNGSFGGMGGAQAEQLYAGTVQLGLRENTVGGGFNRGAALNFGQTMYAHLGMTVEQSMEVIRLAAENGESSLSGIASALDRVSKSAKDAGVNAEQARQNFVSYYRTAIEGGLGPNAGGIAGGIATRQAQLGPTFANMNLGGGIADPRQLLLQAQSQGMNVGDYMASVRETGGAVLQGRAMNTVQQPMAARILGQQGMSAIAPIASQIVDYTKQYGEIPRSQMEEAVTAAMRGNPQLPLIAQQAVKSMFNVDTSSPDEAIEYLIGVQTGALDYEGAAQGGEDASKVEKLSDADRKKLSKTAWGDTAIEKRIGGITQETVGWGAGADRRRQRSENRRYYAEEVIGKRGTASPIVERLLKDQPADRRFKVQTKDGPRVVGLEDAMKYYYDQIASGEAEIVGGAGEGKTAAEALGMSTDPTAGKTIGMDSARTASGKHGQSLDEFNKDKAKGGKGDGRVEIVPAPELAALLRFRPSGSAYVVDSARNNGTTPPRTVPPTER